jgi:CheY-like chemotaxis protein
LKINDLIGGFEMLLRGAAGGAVVLKLDLDLLLRSANLDPAQFESALLNLVVNARDAMPVGGTLTIETRNALVDPTLAARYEIKPGPYVIVTVRDTGEGMTPETKTRAIEPFYTTKEVGKGTGLGLSQVYGFARQSNGHIEIESEIGQGTSVRMFLPLTTELTENAPIAAATEQEIAKSQTILVVEDDPDLLEVAIQIVQSLGYAVYSARNAQEALSVLQRDVPIDLMFTDIIMPGGIDGVDLAHRARVMRPDLRVLLSSGYARDSLASDEDKANDVEFLAKPYLMGELGDRLEALMRTDRSGATLH